MEGRAFPKEIGSYGNISPRFIRTATRVSKAVVRIGE